MGIISILCIAASIFYLRGNAFSNDVFLTGEILDVNNTELVKLKCQSSKEPAFHSVEFFVDHITFDIVKLDKGKCYNSLGECSEKICMCLNAGKDFIWIFYPTDVLKKYVFGCQVRIFDEKNNTFKTTATLHFDGTDFNEQQQMHEYVAINSVAITNSNVNDKDSDSIPIKALIISFVVFVLAVSIVTLIAVYYRKMKGRNGNKRPRNMKEKKQRATEEIIIEDLESRLPKHGNKKLSKCANCRQKTEYAICPTHGGIFCEACTDKHTTNCNNILQLGSSLNKKTKESCFECPAKCFVCKTNKVHFACVKCKQLFCKTCELCKCPESTTQDTIKSLFLPKNDDERHRGTDGRFYTSDKKQDYDICREQNCVVNGMIILDNKRLVVADKENNCLKIMDDQNWHTISDLKSKLLGLTCMYSNIMAATFGNEEKIIIIEVLEKRIKYTDKEIELTSLGQPYEIAYNKNHFAVRIGLELDGRFAVLTVDGKIRYIINNDKQRFGDGTENSFEIALSVSDCCIFVSSSSNNAVYCVHFNGTILWNKEVSCPKGILYVSNTVFFENRNIILACQDSNIIYQLDSESGKLTLLLDAKHGINVPRYVAYKETETEYILYTVTNTGSFQEFVLKPIT